jgi:histone-lysine N-methyltransferase ASH1L
MAEKDMVTEPEPSQRKPRVKKWLTKGLYAGQEAPTDHTKGLTALEKKNLAHYPELQRAGKPNKSLPQPMWNGLRMLISGRDFKLPFDVCNPLPPGQPKPAAYRTMTKSKTRFLTCSCCRRSALLTVVCSRPFHR